MSLLRLVLHTKTATRSGMVSDSGEDSDMASGWARSGATSKSSAGPRWNGKRHTWAEWWYEMVAYLLTIGLAATYKGTNRDLKASTVSERRGREV